MQQSAQAVADLLEMCADDAAARQHGVSPLLGGLLSMAAPRHAIPAEGLAAAGNAVAARAMRLAQPAGGRAKWSQRLVLASGITVMLSAPGLIELLCHH
jgi:hypothetical protein